MCPTEPRIARDLQMMWTIRRFAPGPKHNNKREKRMKLDQIENIDEKELNRRIRYRVVDLHRNLTQKQLFIASKTDPPKAS